MKNLTSLRSKTFRQARENFPNLINPQNPHRSFRDHLFDHFQAYKIAAPTAPLRRSYESIEREDEQDSDRASRVPKKTGTKALMAISALLEEPHCFIRDTKSIDMKSETKVTSDTETRKGQSRSSIQGAFLI